MTKLGDSKNVLLILGGVLAPCVSLGIYFLIINRQLPFLKSDTVLSGGKQVPTEEFIEFISPMFLYVIPVFVVVGVINYFVMQHRTKTK